MPNIFVVYGTNMIYKKADLYCQNEHSNKEYNIWIEDDLDDHNNEEEIGYYLHNSYGKIGSKLNKHFEFFDTFEEAERAFNKIYKSKIAKGYIDKTKTVKKTKIKIKHKPEPIRLINI